MTITGKLNLHTNFLKGVLSFIGAPHRFANGRVFRGWSGLVPRSAQSAESEAKGLHISQAGPDLPTKYAFLDADVGRRWDPQLAKIYGRLFGRKGTVSSMTS
jgi:hypothetical protein